MRCGGDGFKKNQEAPHVHAGLRGYSELMPVYLGTSHAYRSWDENHPKGYVQRDEGLQLPSEGLQRWRSEHAKDEPARFSLEQQQLLHEIVAMIAAERDTRLHATATVATHVHKLFSFRSPACTCGATGVKRSSIGVLRRPEKVGVDLLGGQKILNLLQARVAS